MNELAAPIIGAAATILAAIIASIVSKLLDRSKDRADRSRPWVQIGLIAIAIGIMVGLAVFAALKFWPAAQGTVPQTAAGDGSALSKMPECRPSGYQIGLLVRPTIGRGQMEGTINECEMLTVRGSDQSWGVGFRPVVDDSAGDPAKTTVRIDAFLVTDPGEKQTLAFISSMVVQEGREGKVQVPKPDEGSLLVKVTSVSRPDRES